MLNKIRSGIRQHQILINIFLVYFFLTFSMGYLDFSRRVKDFDFSTECLRRVVTGEFNIPMVHRILVPYLVYSFHRVCGLPLNYSYALFRFVFYFLAFVLFHLYLKKWFDDKSAMIGTLSLIASLPLTLTNWYAIPTDMPELITFILGAIWIRDNKYGKLLFLIPLATLNRETSIALVALYFLNGIGRERTFILIKKTMLCFLCWLLPYALLARMFGIKAWHPLYFFEYNVRGLLSVFTHPNPYNHFYFWIYLCGFYWFMAFRDFGRKDTFLKRSMLVVALYFSYVFCRAGAIDEVRVFIPFYVFVIPLGLLSLFAAEKREYRSKAELK